MTIVKKTKRPRIRIKDNKIKFFLTEMKMSPVELGDLCLTNRFHISKIMNNRSKCISLAMAMRICKILGRQVEEVFILEENGK